MSAFARRAAGVCFVLARTINDTPGEGISHPYGVVDLEKAIDAALAETGIEGAVEKTLETWEDYFDPDIVAGLGVMADRIDDLRQALTRLRETDGEG